MRSGMAQEHRTAPEGLMIEIDHLKVGDGERSGDAITIRFNHPATGHFVHAVIDAGFQDDGDDVVEVIENFYGTRHVDIAFLTHPDGDHIGGMGTVVRELDVELLVLHRIHEHGGNSLPAAKEVKDLVRVAEANGTLVIEAFAGESFIDGCFVVAGPAEPYYDELVAEQVELERTGKRGTAAVTKTGLAEALRAAGQKFLAVLPLETPFGDAGGTSPRNNSSMIIDFRPNEERRILFTGDAGVPAISAALDTLDDLGRNDRAPDLFDVPHHGSRHNLDSDALTRLFGDPGHEENSRFAIVSCTEDAPKHPAPRVVNALIRRGCGVVTTEDGSKRYGQHAPTREGWGPVEPLSPMNEDLEDDN